MNILHLEANRYSESSLSELSNKFNVVQLNCSTQIQLEIYLQQNKFDVIFTKLGLSINKNIIKLQPTLKYIVTATTGLNHIDIEEAKKNNIQIVSLKGEEVFLSSVKSTAEHTWALLLSLIRNIKPAIDSVNNGKWERSHLLCDELDGKTIGIIGFGRLGKIVANYANAFGMNVLVNDINNKQVELLPNHIQSCNLDSLLKQADFVLLMIAFTDENVHFINKDKISLMKKGAYFINTSRGELVNEDDLLQALKNGHLKGAALDVLNKDSDWDGTIQGSWGLVDYAKTNKNLIITPHIGGYGINSILKTRDFVTQKLIQKISIQ